MVRLGGRQNCTEVVCYELGQAKSRDLTSRNADCRTASVMAGKENKGKVSHCLFSFFYSHFCCSEYVYCLRMIADWMLDGHGSLFNVLCLCFPATNINLDVGSNEYHLGRIVKGFQVETLEDI
jgi:hypothetical protein